MSPFSNLSIFSELRGGRAAQTRFSHLGRIKKSMVIIVPDYYRIEAFSGLYPPMTNTWLLFSLHFNHGSRSR
jgi:hypothetical protein